MKVPTPTVVEYASQVGSQSGGTRRVCREYNLDTCGSKGDRRPSKMPTGGDSTPPEAATMSGVASTTQEKINIRIRTAGRKSR